MIVSYSFQVIIILFGTIGNILTIFVLWGERKKTGTAFLLVALAFADTSVLVSVSLSGSWSDSLIDSEQSKTD